MGFVKNESALLSKRLEMVEEVRKFVSHEVMLANLKVILWLSFFLSVIFSIILTSDITGRVGRFAFYSVRICWFSKISLMCGL